MKSRTWPSILAYTSARILIFGCAVILLYVAGARGLLLLFLGLVISALASYILLNRQRQLIADKLNGRLGKAGLEVHRVPRAPRRGHQGRGRTGRDSGRRKSRPLGANACGQRHGTARCEPNRCHVGIFCQLAMIWLSVMTRQWCGDNGHAVIR